MDYLVIGMNLEISSGCQCYGGATYLPKGCGVVCDTYCISVCNTLCSLRYCNGAGRAVPYGNQR